MVQDIKALIKARESYRELADTVGDSIIIFDTKGRFVFLNKDVEIKPVMQETSSLARLSQRC